MYVPNRALKFMKHKLKKLKEKQTNLQLCFKNSILSQEHVDKKNQKDIDF